MKQILIFRFLQCRDSVQLWQETLGDIASQPAKGVSPHKWPRSFSHSLSWFFFFFFLTGVLFPARRCRPLRGIDQPSSALRQICLSTCLHASSKSHEGQQSRRVRHCREQGLYQVVHLCVCVCVHSDLVKWCVEKMLSFCCLLNLPLKQRGRLWLSSILLAADERERNVSASMVAFLL